MAKAKLPVGEARVVVAARVKQSTRTYIERVASGINEPGEQNCGRAIDLIVSACIKARALRLPRATA